MGTISSLFDLVDVTLAKHGNNSASNDANVRVAASKGEIRRQIYEFALLSPNYGITLSEVVRKLGIKVQTASARLSELRKDEYLVPKGEERRENCQVLVPKFAEIKQ